MLLPAGLSGYAFTYDNWGTNPTATPGTAVTPGASNVEGSWTQIASSANIAQDCYWLGLIISGGATATAAKNHLIDIGVDPAGGTSYTAVISNLVCGNSGTVIQNFRQFTFPYFIKSGSSVAVRIQGSNATAGTVRVMAKFYGQPTNPANVPIGSISQTFGTISSSNGTSFTPGNIADGSWVSMGTATTPLWWWQLGVQIDNGTQSAHYTYVDLAVGDVTNKKTILRHFMMSNTSEVNGDIAGSQMAFADCYWPVPSGAEIWVRGRNGAAPVSGYNATVIGIGG
jgi:hypothetical protein